MGDCIELFIRTIVSFITLFIFTKIMGRKELAQMSIFDYIVGISIGSIGSQLALGTDEPWYEYVLVMAVYVGLHYGMSWLSIKSLKIRKVVDGGPIILMQEGVLIEKNLRRVRFDINTFLEECRLGGYFDLSTIQYAIMESNGKISFLEKVQDNPQELVANLIIDGNIMKKNLEAIQKEEEWLMQQLKDQGYENIKEILLVTCDSEYDLKVYLKDRPVLVNHCLE